MASSSFGNSKERAAYLSINVLSKLIADSVEPATMQSETRHMVDVIEFVFGYRFGFGPTMAQDSQRKFAYRIACTDRSSIAQHVVALRRDGSSAYMLFIDRNFSGPQEATMGLIPQITIVSKELVSTEVKQKCSELQALPLVASGLEGANWILFAWREVVRQQRVRKWGAELVLIGWGSTDQPAKILDS